MDGMGWDGWMDGEDIPYIILVTVTGRRKYHTEQNHNQNSLGGQHDVGEKLQTSHLYV